METVPDLQKELQKLIASKKFKREMIRQSYHRGEPIQRFFDRIMYSLANDITCCVYSPPISKIELTQQLEQSGFTRMQERFDNSGITDTRYQKGYVAIVSRESDYSSALPLWYIEYKGKRYFIERWDTHSISDSSRYHLSLVKYLADDAEHFERNMLEIQLLARQEEAKKEMKQKVQRRT